MGYRLEQFQPFDESILLKFLVLSFLPILKIKFSKRLFPWASPPELKLISHVRGVVGTGANLWVAEGLQAALVDA